MKNATKLVSLVAVILFALLLTQPVLAYAYVGPSAGLSLFSAAVGFLVAIFSAIGIILLWPIRMLLKWIRGNANAKMVEEGDTAQTD